MSRAFAYILHSPESYLLRKSCDERTPLISASSNCAVDKLHLATTGAMGRGALAAAAAVAVLTAATYAIAVKPRPSDITPTAVAQANIPSTRDAPVTRPGAPQPLRAPEATPRPSMVGASDHVVLISAKSHSRPTSMRDGSMPHTVGQNGSGGRFDAISIAAFLRTDQASAKQRKGGRSRMAATVAVAALEADGVSDEPTTPVKQAASEKPSAPSKDAPGDPSLAFATALGQIKTAARAGVMNGQPAAALNIDMTTGPFVIDASGMSEVTNLSEPGGFRKTFKLSTRASIPLD